MEEINNKEIKKFHCVLYQKHMKLSGFLASSRESSFFSSSIDLQEKNIERERAEIESTYRGTVVIFNVVI